MLRRACLRAFPLVVGVVDAVKNNIVPAAHGQQPGQIFRVARLDGEQGTGREQRLCFGRRTGQQRHAVAFAEQGLGHGLADAAGAAEDQHTELGVRCHGVRGALKYGPKVRPRRAGLAEDSRKSH